MYPAQDDYSSVESDETTVLVTHGVFRLSRNPMYLALLLLLLAYYLYQPTWVSPFIFILVSWYLTRFQILVEERILSEKFGDQYQHMRLRYAGGSSEESIITIVIDSSLTLPENVRRCTGSYA